MIRSTVLHNQLCLVLILFMMKSYGRRLFGAIKIPQFGGNVEVLVHEVEVVEVVEGNPAA